MITHEYLEKQERLLTKEGQEANAKAMAADDTTHQAEFLSVVGAGAEEINGTYQKAPGQRNGVSWWWKAGEEGTQFEIWCADDGAKWKLGPSAHQGQQETVRKVFYTNRNTSGSPAGQWDVNEMDAPEPAPLVEDMKK
jgi:hypothetical protein